MPAIWRAAAVNPVTAVCVTHLGRLASGPLRAPSQTSQLPRPSARIRSPGARRSASARRAWEPGLPAIWRAAAVNPANAVCLIHLGRLVSGPLRAPSQTSQLPRPSARIKSPGARGPASARRAWERGLPAIWREAAVNPANAVCLIHLGRLVSGPLRAPSQTSQLPRPSARIKSMGARRSASPAAFGQNQKPRRTWTCFCPEGVGAWLARDLARSGSKPCQRGMPDTPRSSGFRAAARPIADKSAPTAFGPNQKPGGTAIRFSHGLRPESEAWAHAETTSADDIRPASAEGV